MNLDSKLFSKNSYELASALAAFEKFQKVELVQTNPADAEWAASTRELFCELVGVGLGNLYNKIPLPSALFDMSMIKMILEGLDDAEATLLVDRTEEWLRYEGLVRILAGQRNEYVMTSRAISVLSVTTPEGSLGMQLTQACACYARNYRAPELRIAVRRLVTTILAALST
ncbi:MAG: hypothetical protein HKN11_00510 [Rhizobiales bacterium]|nr:hypothetical protein [Hyphomicrobiales bacterium]